MDTSLYPVRFSVDYPDRPLDRVTTFSRIIVALPILILPGVAVICRGDRGRREPFDGQVDAEPQLPDELRDGRDALPRAAEVEDAEHHGDSRRADQRPADEA